MSTQANNQVFYTSVSQSLSSSQEMIARVFFVTLLALLASACNNVKSMTVPVQPVITPPSVALVLGGGGAKGFAHVGVIKALEENGITPTLVVGTSVGSLVGSLYASGYTPTQLEQLALTTPDSALTDFTLSNQGFVEGLKLKNFINAKVKGQAIEAFPIAFAAVAAEKSSLKKAAFTKGDAGLAVQASCSIPNIFIAPRIPENGGKKYIDGGVVSLVPVDSARDLGADIIIAVDVTVPTNKPNPTLASITSLSSFWGLLENNLAVNINGTANSRSSMMRNERDRADVIIIPDVGHISSLDTSQRQALIDAGEQATKPQIDTVKKAIKKVIEEKSKSEYATL